MAKDEPFAAPGPSRSGWHVGLQYCHGLNPAQWDSLRFVGQANRFSRTPGALAILPRHHQGDGEPDAECAGEEGLSEPSSRPRRSHGSRHIELTRARGGICWPRTRSTAWTSRDMQGCRPETVDTMAKPALARTLRGHAGAVWRSGSGDLSRRAAILEGATDDGQHACAAYKQAELTCEDAKRVAA